MNNLILLLGILVGGANAGRSTPPPSMFIEGNGANQKIVIQAQPGQSVPVLEYRDENGNVVQTVDKSGAIATTEIKVSSDPVNLPNAYRIAIDSMTGGVKLDTSKEVVFSSNVIIVGDFKANSGSANIFKVRAGGFILEPANANGPTTPRKGKFEKLETSTIVFIGSAMFWKNDAGVIVSTFTKDSIDLGAGTISGGEISGDLKSKRFVSTTPPGTDCDESSEQGLIVTGNSPKRLYLCVDDGGGSFEWRFTNLNVLP